MSPQNQGHQGQRSQGRSNAVGAYGERVAERYLVEREMVVLDRNWRCPRGEIDLVLRSGSTLVICEVKTRRDDAFGSPIEAVTPAKARRLRLLADLWVEAHGLRVTEIRIDIVGVVQDGRGAGEVMHVEGVA